MFVLGIILILLTAGLVLAAVFGGADDRADFDMGSLELSVSTTVVFLLGALTLLLLMMGLALIRIAARRAAARRRESKEFQRLSAKLEERESEGHRDAVRHEDDHSSGERHQSEQHQGERQDGDHQDPHRST